MPRRSRPKKRQNDHVKIYLLIFILLVILAIPAVLIFQLNAQATLAQYQAVARQSLSKLCSSYVCPPPPKPGTSYVESALTRIHFSTQSEYDAASLADGGSKDSVGQESFGLTTKKEPREIYINLDNAKKLEREGIPLEDALEEMLDHEVVHQAAIEHKLEQSLTLDFNDKRFVAVSTVGLSLIGTGKDLGLNRTNEGFTQWLALPQLRTHKVSYTQLYDAGPQVIEWLNTRAGLDRKKAFDLYVNQGISGFSSYYGNLAGKTMSGLYGPHAGLSVLVYLDRVLDEIDHKQYSIAEAERRLNYFMVTGDAPPQK